MTEIAYVNGEFLPLSEARISINDRGFVFGDGVYEVVCGYDGRLWAMARHWRRLERSLAELQITGVDLAALQQLALEAVARAGTSRPMLYLQITRGIADRAHAWDAATILPTVVLTVREAPRLGPAAREQGIACLTIPENRWARCDIKSLNLIPNVMAKQQARQAGALEALFVRGDGTVTEGSSSSVCRLKDGVLSGHPWDSSVLPSITRDLLFELAEDLAIPVRGEPFSRDALMAADELILCGTTTEVLGIVTVDGQTIGGGRVGPVTRRLIDAYLEAIARGADAPRD